MPPSAGVQSWAGAGGLTQLVLCMRLQPCLPAGSELTACSINKTPHRTHPKSTPQSQGRLAELDSTGLGLEHQLDAYKADKDALRAEKEDLQQQLEGLRCGCGRAAVNVKCQHVDGRTVVTACRPT